MKKWKRWIAFVTAFLVAFTGVITMPGQQTVAKAAVIPDDSVSLKYVSTVTADTAGSVLRVYGDEGTTYSIPININANCTVLLDNVKTSANLTVANGVNATVVLRGTCRVGNIVAVGGAKTTVSICGEDGNGTLTTTNIAYGTGASSAGGAQTGANVNINGCTVVCNTLGVGGNGSAWTEGMYPAAYGAAGGSCSPVVNIENATVSVSGSIACGGAGSATTGYYSVSSGVGGNAGAVNIRNSYVSVGGSVACGGAGSGTNLGYLGGSYSEAGNSAPVTIAGSTVTVKGSMAIGGRGSDGSTWGYNGSSSCFAGGATKPASNVTITDGSVVQVDGNVSTAQTRAAYNSQGGLNGATVKVMDSTLTANDIASGSPGGNTSYSASTGGSSTSGSAGGAGGSLIASNAVINCKTAVNGANASNGSYAYSGGSYGTYYYNDGKGGYLNVSNTVLNVTGNVGQRGTTNAGNEYKGGYSDSFILGGTVKGGGTIYGGVITTDLTSYIVSSLAAATDIRNTEEASVAKCTFHIDERMAGKTVNVTANNLAAENVTLDSEGKWITYLAVGKEVVKLRGDGIYSGTYMVKRSASLNEFTLDPYGILDMTYDSADIFSDHYEYTGEIYEYIGEYHVRGASESSDLTVHEGMQTLTFTDVTMDVLTIKGSSDVTIVLNGTNKIHTINVEENAKLTVRGDGSLGADKVGNTNGSVGTIIFESGTFEIGDLGAADGSGDISLGQDAVIDIGNLNADLKDADGTSLYQVTFIMGKAGTYDVTIGSESEQITLSEGESSFTKLLPEGSYEVVIVEGLLKYRGVISVHASQSMYLDDLELYVDISDGDVIIRDGSIQIGDTQYETDADIHLIQTGDKHTVTIEKEDAYVTLDGVDPDVQIYLPENFNGIIEDVAGAPVQLVTIHTPYPDTPVKLLFDEKEYEITTNAQGDFTILAGCTTHTIGLEINGVSYRTDGEVRVSASNNSFTLDDFLCILDLSKGDIQITENGFESEGVEHVFDGNYIITQSQDEKGMMIVQGGDSNIAVDQNVDANLQAYVSEDYSGSITVGGVSVGVIKIETPYISQDVTVTIGTETYVYGTDANGDIYAVVVPGDYVITYEGSDGAIYTAAVTVGYGYDNVAKMQDFNGEKIEIIDGIKYRYPIVEGVMGDPQMIGPDVRISGDMTICAGDRVEIRLDAVPSMENNSLSYEWYQEGTLIYQSESLKEELPDVPAETHPDEETEETETQPETDDDIMTGEIVSQGAISGSAITDSPDMEAVSPEAVQTSDPVTAETVSGSAIAEEPVEDARKVNENVMTIDPFTADYAGTYTVIVKESNGAWTEETFTLSIQEPGTEEPEQPSTDPEEKPSDGDTTGSGSETEGETSQPSGGGSSSGSSSSGGTSSSGGNAGGGSSSGGNWSYGGSSGGGSSTGGSSATGGSAGSGEAAIEGNGTEQQPSSGGTTTTTVKKKVVKPSIKMTSNLKGLKLKKTGTKNTYKLRKKGTLKMKITVPKGCKVYYKVVVKGKKSTQVKWKKLTKKTLSIKASSKYKRVYFKVVGSNKKTIYRKTGGFIVKKK